MQLWDLQIKPDDKGKLLVVPISLGVKEQVIMVRNLKAEVATLKRHLWDTNKSLDNIVSRMRIEFKATHNDTKAWREGALITISAK
jgi:hypothetical protein